VADQSTCVSAGGSAQVGGWPGGEGEFAPVFIDEYLLRYRELEQLKRNLAPLIHLAQDSIRQLESHLASGVIERTYRVDGTNTRSSQLSWPCPGQSSRNTSCWQWSTDKSSRLSGSTHFTKGEGGAPYCQWARRLF